MTTPTSPHAARTAGLDQPPVATGDIFSKSDYAELRMVAKCSHLQSSPNPVLHQFGVLGLLAREELKRRGL